MTSPAQSTQVLVAVAPRRARSSAVVALGLLANALIGVGQSILLTAFVGPGRYTDAFLAAYSVALPVVLLASTFRGQLVPLFGSADDEPSFRARAVEVCSRSVLLGMVMSGVLLATAPAAALIVARGLPADAQWTAFGALLILGLSSYLQFRAAALSALLVGARRFDSSAAIYVVAGLVALGASAIALPLIGAVGAAVGLFIGAAVLAVGHERYARRFGVRLSVEARWLRERAQLQLGLTLVGYASLGLAQQLNLSLALGAVSGATGAITVYTFAFLCVLMLLNVTNVSLGLVLLPDLVESLGDGSPHAAARHLARVSGFALALLAPMLVGAVVYGKPLLEVVLGPLFDTAEIGLMADLIALFCLLAIPTALLQTGVTIAVAERRWRLTLAAAILSVAAQAALTWTLDGEAPQTVAATHSALAIATAALFLLALFGRRAGDAARRVGRPVIAAVGLSGLVAAPRLLLGDQDAYAASAGLAMGIALYLIALWHAWPAVGRPLLARFGPMRELPR